MLEGGKYGISMEEIQNHLVTGEVTTCEANLM